MSVVTKVRKPKQVRRGDFCYVVSVWTDWDGLDHGQVFASKARAESYAAKLRRDSGSAGEDIGDMIVWVQKSRVR